MMKSQDFRLKSLIQLHCRVSGPLLFRGLESMFVLQGHHLTSSNCGLCKSVSKTNNNNKKNKHFYIVNYDVSHSLLSYISSYSVGECLCC